MDAILGCLCLTSNSARGKRSSLPPLRTLPNRFRARDCMIFTLHDLTDLYIERVTAHSIKSFHVFITSGQTPKRN